MNVLFVLSLVVLINNVVRLGSFGFSKMMVALILPSLSFIAALLILYRGSITRIDWGARSGKLSVFNLLLFTAGFLIIYGGIILFKISLDVPLTILAVVMSSAYLVMLGHLFSGKLDCAVGIFILCFPFLNLAEQWLGLSAETFETGLVVTPTVIFLFTLFIGAIVSSGKDRVAFSGIQIALFCCLILFLLSGFVSAVLSVSPEASIRHYLLHYVCPLMIMPAVFFGIDSLQKIKNFINIVTLSFFMNVAIFFYMFQRYGKGLSNLFDVYSASLASGFTSGIMAILILFIFPLVVFMIFVSKEEHLIKRYYAVLAVLLGLLMATFSRSGLISFFVGISALLFFEKNKRFLWIVSISLVILCSMLYIFASSPELNRYSTLLGGLKGSSSEARFNAWSGSVSMIRDYPVFGIGSGLWGKFVPNYCPTQHINLMVKGGKLARGYIMDPHNMLFTVYLETGFFGFFFWILLLVIPSIYAFGYLYKNRNGYGRELGMAYLVFILANSIHSLSNSDLLINNLFLYGCIYWAIHAMFVRNIFGCNSRESGG